MTDLQRDHGTRAQLLERAKSVVPVLRDAAPRIEQARELPDDVVAALHSAGLFRLLLPKSVGGDEIDLRTHAELLEIVATADASATWCLSQGAGCAMSAAFLNNEVARRLFGPSNAVLAWGAGAQGKAVAVDGGYRVTGTWPFNSGCMHATLLGAHSRIFEADGSPRNRADGRQLDRTLILPREKATVTDVWHVMGLKGTGSNTFSVEDLFVPEEETIDRENLDELSETGPLYLFSASLAYGVGFAALQLGIARGILDDLQHLASTKTPRGSGALLRDSSVFQSQLARTEGRYRAARAYLHMTADEVYRNVAAAGEITLDDRVTMKLATVHTIHEAVEIITDAYRHAGNDAIFPDNHFERRLRDAYTASQQTQARVQNFTTIGRHLLGLEPDTMTFL
ncbi:MAG: acyl-CoA dehydrogenase family protein [Hyphomicrobiaceae bacterium]